LGDGGTGFGNGGSGLGSVGLGTGSVGPGPGFGAGIGSEIKPANELFSPIATVKPNPTRLQSVRLITGPFPRNFGIDVRLEQKPYRNGKRLRLCTLTGIAFCMTPPSYSCEFVCPARGPFEIKTHGPSCLETNRFTLSRKLVAWAPLRAINRTTMPALRRTMPAAITNSRVFGC